MLVSIIHTATGETVHTIIPRPIDTADDVAGMIRCCLWGWRYDGDAGYHAEIDGKRFAE